MVVFGGMTDALRLIHKLLKRQDVAQRVMIPDKLRSSDAAKREIVPDIEHRSHKGLNNCTENLHQPVRRREKRMMRFKSAGHCQRFVSVHGHVANLFHLNRKHLPASDYQHLCNQANSVWREVALSVAA